MPTTITVYDDGKIEGYWSVAEAAKIWNVSVDLVRLWIFRKKIDVLKVGTDNYIEAMTPKPTDKRRKNRNA